jgi:hypothetical protein
MGRYRVHRPEGKSMTAPLYLVITMDDDHKGHPTFCPSEDAVRDVVRDAMFMPGELDADEQECVRQNAATLIEEGAIHFEGDPSIHLYRMADLRGPTYPADDMRARRRALVHDLMMRPHPNPEHVQAALVAGFGSAFTNPDREALLTTARALGRLTNQEVSQIFSHWDTAPLPVGPALAEGKAADYAREQQCWCERCTALAPRIFMILCPTCGNKRCPRASWHGYKCTGSNDVGQVGEPE